METTTNKTEGKRYFLPTIPYSLIDAINRAAAATGSIGYAMAASSANYNGHSISVTFNEYRKYWITEYWWAGRVVITRGSCEQALRAGKAEYDRGAKGARITTGPLTEEQAAYAVSLGYQEWSEEAEKAADATWEDSRHAQVGDALWWQKNGHPEYIPMLLECKTGEEYTARKDLTYQEMMLPRYREWWKDAKQAKNEKEVARLTEAGKACRAKVEELRAQLGREPLPATPAPVSA